MNLSWTIAKRYMKPRQGERMISVIGNISRLGITIGVAALIVVMSVMNGFRTELLKSLLSYNGHLEILTPMKSGISPEDPFLKVVQERANAITVPVVAGEAVLSLEGQAKGMFLRGLDFGKDAKSYPFLKDMQVVSGEYPQPGEVMVGAEARRAFGLQLGQSLKFIAPEGNSTPFGLIPRTRSFKISGFFTVHMTDYDTSVALVNREDAQKFLRLGTQVNRVEVFIPDPEKAPEVMEALKPHTPPGLYLVNWRQTQGPMATALEVERNVMFVILSLIILVAAFNIVSSMIMLVNDKVQEIAILRTMGATRQQILTAFLMLGTSHSIIGSLGGCALGLLIEHYLDEIHRFLEIVTGTKLFDAQVYFLSSLPSELRMEDVIGIVTISFLLTFLASLYPAWRAANLNPIEGLRHD